MFVTLKNGTACLTFRATVDSSYKHDADGKAAYYAEPRATQNRSERQRPINVLTDRTKTSSYIAGVTFPVFVF